MLHDSLLPGQRFNVVSHLVPLTLLLLSDVLFEKSVSVLDLHVYRVVHETFVLYGNGKLFNLVLAVCGHLILSGLCEILFLVVVEVLAVDYVEVVGFPVLLSRLRPLDFLINLKLLIV